MARRERGADRRIRSVRETLSVYLVNELYDNVDVGGELAEPPAARSRRAGGPTAAGVLRQAATDSRRAPARRDRVCSSCSSMRSSLAQQQARERARGQDRARDLDRRRHRHARSPRRGGRSSERTSASRSRRSTEYRLDAGVDHDHALRASWPRRRPRVQGAYSVLSAAAAGARAGAVRAGASTWLAAHRRATLRNVGWALVLVGLTWCSSRAGSAGESCGRRRWPRPTSHDASQAGVADRQRDPGRDRLGGDRCTAWRSLCSARCSPARPVRDRRSQPRWRRCSTSAPGWSGPQSRAPILLADPVGSDTRAAAPSGASCCWARCSPRAWSRCAPRRSASSGSRSPSRRGSRCDDRRGRLHPRRTRAHTIVRAASRRETLAGQFRGEPLCSLPTIRSSTSSGTMLIFFAWVIWFWILITVIDRHLPPPGRSQAGARRCGSLFVVFLPYLGVLDLPDRAGQGDGPARRADEIRAGQAQFDEHVRSAAGTSGEPTPPSRSHKAKQPARQRRDRRRPSSTQLKRKALA